MNFNLFRKHIILKCAYAGSSQVKTVRFLKTAQVGNESKLRKGIALPAHFHSRRKRSLIVLVSEPGQHSQLCLTQPLIVVWLGGGGLLS